MLNELNWTKYVKPMSFFPAWAMLNLSRLVPKKKKKKKKKKIKQLKFEN